MKDLGLNKPGTGRASKPKSAPLALNPGSCAFCGDPAVACCQWSVERFVCTQYATLQPGDRVRRATENIAPRPAALVEGIAPWFANDKATEPAGLQVGLRIGKRYKEIIILPESPVRVARQQPCATLICEKHLRCVEAGVEYCVDHWGAWQAVA